jgi:hypothetical protein
VRPYLKNKLKPKISGDMTEIIEHLPSKFKALSSNPYSAKKPKQAKKQTKIMIPK